MTTYPSTGNRVYAEIPCSLYGTETENATAIILSGSHVGYSTNIGRLSFPIGSIKLSRLVDFRWVSSNSSSTVHISVPGCPCAYIPTTLNMTSSKPSSNNQIFQNATFNYGPPPAGLAALNLGTNCYLSTAQFKDFSTNDMFWYYFSCFQGFYILTRVYAVSTYSSPYRDQIRYRWLAGTTGNTCTPFSLTAGAIFSGGDASCKVAISG